VGLLFPRPSTKQTDEQTVLKAKQDCLVREEFIASHRQWLLRATGRACRRYIGPEDEQYAIALLALDEAITAYQPQQAAAFYTFAEQVIRRRLIDWQRQQRRPEVAWSQLAREEDEVPIEEQLMFSASLEAQRLSEERQDRQDEIRRLNKDLKGYGISFADLVRISPRHKDARENAQRVALILSQSPHLLEHLMQKQSLPLKDLQQLVSVSRKTLERQRKYIITLTVILVGDYPLIKSFIDWSQGGDEDAG
jgi:RNA polymerase sigma factor